ncbi:hypothetical protein RFI_20015, partial [Reticulomyxa filosa]
MDEIFSNFFKDIIPPIVPPNDERNRGHPRFTIEGPAVPRQESNDRRPHLSLINPELSYYCQIGTVVNLISNPSENSSVRDNESDRQVQPYNRRAPFDSFGFDDHRPWSIFDRFQSMFEVWIKSYLFECKKKKKASAFQKEIETIGNINPDYDQHNDKLFDDSNPRMTLLFFLTCLF